MVNDSQKYIYKERSKRIYGFLLILVRLDIDLFKKKKKKGYILDIFYFNILKEYNIVTKIREQGNFPKWPIW